MSTEKDMSMKNERYPSDQHYEFVGGAMQVCCEHPEANRIPGPMRMVLMAMARLVDDSAHGRRDAVCRGSLADVARWARYSERTVTKAMERLEALGLIERIEPAGWRLVAMRAVAAEIDGDGGEPR